MNLPDRPHRANYEVGGQVQNAFEGIVIHHQRVVIGVANVVGIADHSGTLVPYNWLQEIKILIYGGVIGLPDNPAVGGV